MAAGEFHAAFSDHGVIAFWEDRRVGDKMVHVGLFTGEFDFVLGRVLGEAIDDILADGSREEDWLLLDNGHIRLITLRIQISQILITVSNGAAERVVEPLDQLNDRRLSTARAANQGHSFVLFNFD